MRLGAWPADASRRTERDRVYPPRRPRGRAKAAALALGDRGKHCLRAGRRATIGAVTQSTLVFKLPATTQRALRQRLDAEAFEFRRVPHAVFSARGSGVIATLYRSGKLVVQGRECELFVERFLPGEGVCSTPRAFIAGFS